MESLVINYMYLIKKMERMKSENSIAKNSDFIGSITIETH